MDEETGKPRGTLPSPDLWDSTQTFLNTSGLSEDLPITASSLSHSHSGEAEAWGKRDPSSEAPVFKQPVAVPVLCAHTEQTVPQSAARWSSSCPSLVL